MKRGSIGMLTKQPFYKNYAKRWIVALESCSWTWFDMVSNPGKDPDTKASALKRLRDLANGSPEDFETRFVYFIASRPRVRFDTSFIPCYSRSNRPLQLVVEVGKHRDKRLIEVVLTDQHGPAQPKVTLTPERIRISHTESSSTNVSVHDFLYMIDCDLAHSSDVHYVGVTRSPHKRPIDRQHRGYADTVGSIPADANDFFVYHHRFNVTSIGVDPAAPVSIVVPNAAIDEVGVDDEARIIESILALYFDAKNQETTRGRDSAELQNRLAQLQNQHKIDSVALGISFDKPNAYFRYGSRKIPHAHEHLISCRLVDQKINVSSGVDF
jgi:hypothetical protein